MGEELKDSAGLETGGPEDQQETKPIYPPEIAEQIEGLSEAETIYKLLVIEGISPRSKEETRRVIKFVFSHKSAEKLARESAEAGAISRTLDFLEESGLSPKAKREILARAYEKEANRRASFAEIIVNNPSLRDFYQKEAERSEETSKKLQGE